MQIVTKIHSRCNINCTYCYMYNMGDRSFTSKPKRIPWAVVRKIPDMLNSYFVDHPSTKTISLALHGGEPLLVGKAYLRSMIDYIRDHADPSRVNISLQTNAMLIDAAWIELLASLQLPVSASLDGPPHINDRRRRYDNGAGSGREAAAGIRMLAESQVDFAGVLCVIDPDSDGKEIVDYFVDELKLKWFDFLLPDFTHDQVGADWPVIQQKLSIFLERAFEQWFERLDENIGCRFFESIIARGLGRTSAVDTVGRDGVTTVVLETDGTLEPHDVARICAGFDRFTGIPVGAGALQELMTSTPYTALANDAGVVSEICRSCSQYGVCRGGHLFHRYSRARGFSNPSVHCFALKHIMQHIEGAMVRRLVQARSRSVGIGAVA